MQKNYDSSEFGSWEINEYNYGVGEKSARYDSSKTEEELKDIKNGIWLCSNCHNIIDSDVEKFPPEKVFEIKNTHEIMIEELLETGSPVRIPPKLKFLDKKEMILIHERIQLLDTENTAKKISDGSFSSLEEYQEAINVGAEHKSQLALELSLFKII